MMKSVFTIFLILICLPAFVIAGNKGVLSKHAAIRMETHPVMSGMMVNSSTQPPAVSNDSDVSIIFERTFNPLANEDWNLLPLTNSPPARYCHIQVYDAKNNIITIFGGWHYNPNTDIYTMYDDTWQANLNTSSWQKIETEVNPSARGSYAILDSINDRIIMFGGFAISGSADNFYPYYDLWQFDLDSLKWSQLYPIGSPPECFSERLVYDSNQNRIVLFGGNTLSPPSYSLNETWALELDSLKWSKLNTIGALPEARWGHGAIYDPSEHRLIIFGGKTAENENLKCFNDLWELDLGSLEWREINFLDPAPEPRAAMAMVHDYPNNRLVIFGGEKPDFSSLNDLWEFNLTYNKWNYLSTAEFTPAERSWMTGNYDPVNGRMLLFGGNRSFTEMLNDTWELTLPEQTSHAGIILVPEDQPSIQEAIDAAVESDLVLVADSTYYENINFKGKAITVASYYYVDGDTNHINNTVINGSEPSDASKGSVVSFTSGEDTNSVIYGFTITGGTGTLYDSNTRVGGGIYCTNSGARIAYNKIVANTVNHDPECDGGGIGCWPYDNLTSKYLIIENNLIESNSVHTSNGTWLAGGGIYITKGRIAQNIIRYNSVFGNSFAGGGGIGINCDDDANRTLVTISGNTITHNQAIAPGTYGGFGGGVDVVFCNIHLLNNVIAHNETGGSRGIGGGVRLWRSKDISIVKDNIISFNSSTGSVFSSGGGLLYNETSGVTVQNNHFEGNTGEFGGGILEEDSKGGNITGNEFVNNRADSSGGAFYFQLSTLNVTENLFRENSAKYGGGMFSHNGNYQIMNNTFVENEAWWGGGINSHTNLSGNIAGNEFVNNSADSSGGACYLHKSNLILTKNLFRENRAKYGGAVLDYFGNYQITNNIFSENKAHWGGGIYNVDQPSQDHLVQIINNTLTVNSADTAGAVVCYNTKVILMNTICWGNTAPHGPEIGMWGGTLYAAHSDIAFGADSIAIDSAATINWLDGNIEDNPLLVADSLSNSSPCISGGIDIYTIDGTTICTCPSEDINGRLRPYPTGSMPDMGAWESKQGVVGIESEQLTGIPQSHGLFQNYPNPFNPRTVISWQLAVGSNVDLSIYNILGQKVATLVSENQKTGRYHVEWDASGFASGVYYYRLTIDKGPSAGSGQGFVQTRKLVLLK